MCHVLEISKNINNYFLGNENKEEILNSKARILKTWFLQILPKMLYNYLTVNLSEEKIQLTTVAKYPS